MTNNYLPNDYQSFYYVYFHVDPDTCKIMYIGMGQKGRAWAITNSGGDNAAYGNRNKDHYEWFVYLESLGYTLNEIVEITAKGLTKQEALALERDLILEHAPKFNKVAGLNNLKITPEKYETALLMRGDGLSYSKIADELDLSTMTIYRALNGKTKNVGEDYGN